MGQAYIPVCAYCGRPNYVRQFTVDFDRFEFLHPWHAGPYRIAHPPANAPTTLILPPPKVVYGPAVQSSRRT
jgi:hypothetical protein